MKIIIMGASGRIGNKIADVLSATHDLVRVGSRSGDIQCDYTNEQSVRHMFDQTGQFDALIAVVGGDSTFKPFPSLEDNDYRFGFERKFLGQVRLVRLGQNRVRDQGSFTLTSGFLSHYPNPASIATGPLNAAVDTFVRNTAPLFPRGIRINGVSPAPIVEPGQEQRGVVTAEQTAKKYVEAVEGTFTGQILRAWGGLPVPDESHLA